MHITGGEPLLREDLLDIVGILAARGIRIGKLLTNGWLLDEAFLDGLEGLGSRPRFQLSFDGVGCHDFLRGVKGAEERTIRALRLLRERGHEASVSMCLHRENRHMLRESVNLMASLGVREFRCATAMELGDWASPEVRSLRLTREEELGTYEEYIPRYFEDDAPLSLSLGSFFFYTPGDDAWRIPCRTACPAEDEWETPSCNTLVSGFFVGADGMVCPCMAMADSDYACHFPSIFETPLREILTDDGFNRLCHVSVGEVREHNPKCRTCPFVDRCTGGCRNDSLMAGEGYCGVAPDTCWFFEHDGERRVTQAAENAFAAYLGRLFARKG